MKFDAIFLDRDGTISHDPYGYINDVKDYDFFDFTFEALELLHQYSDKFFIVTNQSGLSTGKIDIDNLEGIHAYINDEFRKRNGPPERAISSVTVRLEITCCCGGCARPAVSGAERSAG